jgi:hypothetical protein
MIMSEEKCDTKVWSGKCEHVAYTNLSEKYLCDFCESIPESDHEVSHEGFVHIKGDPEKLA